jgi:hypothetical protein
MGGDSTGRVRAGEGGARGLVFQCGRGAQRCKGCDEKITEAG